MRHYREVHSTETSAERVLCQTEVLTMTVIPLTMARASRWIPTSLGQRNSPCTLGKGEGKGTNGEGRIEAQALPLAYPICLPALDGGPQKSGTHSSDQPLGKCCTFLPDPSRVLTACQAHCQVQSHQDEEDNSCPPQGKRPNSGPSTSKPLLLSTGCLLGAGDRLEKRLGWAGWGKGWWQHAWQMQAAIGCSFPSLRPAPAAACGALPPPHPHTSILH